MRNSTVSQERELLRKNVMRESMNQPFSDSMIEAGPKVRMPLSQISGPAFQNNF